MTPREVCDLVFGPETSDAPVPSWLEWLDYLEKGDE